ncbi:MAG: tetratricopeptide repeat protein [Planctomycetia bacterium]|nr:tetratricopeptide repeat protein [Planctomycetia bacterium]
MRWINWLVRLFKKPTPIVREKLVATSTTQTIAPAGAIDLPRQKLDQARAMGDNSPLMVFEHNGSMMVMDRDAYDFSFGPVVGSQPRQQDIDELFPQVTRVCVLDGSLYQGKPMSSLVIADVSDPSAIAELQQSLRIEKEADSNKHCHCLGGPTLELYHDKHLIAVIGLQHGKAIRWKRWHPDADLVDGDQLTRWLQNQGIASDKLKTLYERGNNHLLGDPPDMEFWKALNQLGERTRVLFQLGQQASMLPKVSELIAQYPHRPEPYSLRADIYDTLQQFEQMSADCQAAIDRGLRTAAIFFMRARCSNPHHDSDGVIADTSHALLYQPDYVDALNMRALAYSLSNQPDEALKDWESTIQKAPDWFTPYQLRAQLLHQQGKLDLAMKDINRALHLVEMQSIPEATANIYLLRGDIRWDLFQEEQALEDFKQAQSIFPAIAGKLGELLLRRGDRPRALEAFSSMIPLAPQDARGYAACATVHIMLEQYEQAIEKLTKAIHLQPDVFAYSLRAQAYQYLKRDEEALADYNQHLAIHPNDVNALVNRSSLTIKRGEYLRSLKDREDAHLQAPQPMTANLLAWALATTPIPELRDGTRAVGLAEQACIATEWKLDYMIDTLAAAYAEAGQFEEAKRYQQQVLDMMTKEPTESRRDRQARLKLYQNGQPYRLDQVNPPS